MAPIYGEAKMINNERLSISHINVADKNAIIIEVHLPDTDSKHLLLEKEGKNTTR